jgi:hypothetical protein
MTSYAPPYALRVMTVTSGDGRLGVGVDQLRAAADDAVPLLVGAGQEAGHVDERQHRDVERVAGAHEARRLLGRVDVEAAGELHRLVGDDADRAALDPAEAEMMFCANSAAPRGSRRRRARAR